MAKTKKLQMLETGDGLTLYADGGKARKGMASLGVVRSSAKKNRGSETYDAIIIGAGFAGLMAARELSQRDLSVLVIEARDRIGGRTFAAHIDGYDYEIGGTWIHWNQPFVWAEIMRYGLTLKESAGAMPEHISYLSGGKLHEALAEEVWTRLSEAMTKYCDVDGAGARTIFPRPHDPLHSNLVAKYDHMSLLDRLDEIDVTPAVRDMLNSMLSLDCHGDPAAAGLVDQLRWWALGDHDMGLLFDRCGRYKIKEGTSHLAKAILDDVRGDILLNTHVTAVHDQGDKRVVETRDGKSYEGNAVICALPMNVINEMMFSPPLSDKKVAASKTGHAGKGTKFWVKISEKIGAWFGMAPFPNQIIAAWTDSEREDGTYIVCFGTPGAVDLSDFDAVVDAVHTLLPNATVQKVISHDWANDAYSRGTWCFYKPGELSESLSALQKPHGSVFFAGSDWANGWRGFIDGAIESGIAAAQAVVAELEKTNGNARNRA